MSTSNKKPPAPAKPSALTQSAEALALVKPEMEALAPADFAVINIDIPQAVSVVLGVAPHLRSLRPQIAKSLPDHPIATFDKLETYALAAYHAHILWLPPETVENRVAALLEEATPLRDNLLGDAEAHKDLKADYILANPPFNDISTRLLGFTNWYMSDAKLREAMEDDVTRNQGLHRILVEYEDHVRHQAQQPALTINLLAEMAGNSPAVEHVLAQEPGFKPAARGFADEEDYAWQINRLGNLVLLERAINSRGGNKPPETKAKDANIYQASSYQTVRELGIQIQGKKVPWRKSDIETRTAALVDYVLERWPLWDEPQHEE